MELIFPFILFGMGIVSLMFAVNIYLYQDWNIEENKIVTIMCFAIFFWCGGFAVQGLSGNDFTLAAGARGVELAGVFVFLIYLNRFCLKIAGIAKERRGYWQFAFAVTGIVIYVIDMQPGAISFVATSYGTYFTKEMLYPSIIHNIYVAAVAGTGFYYMIRSRLHAVLIREKKRMNILLAAGIFLAGGSLFDTFLPAFTDAPIFPGSAVGAFIACLLAHLVERNYMAFSISENNMSKYFLQYSSLPVLILAPDGAVRLMSESAKHFFEIVDENPSFSELFETGISDDGKMPDLMDLEHMVSADRETVFVDKVRGRSCFLNINMIRDPYEDLLCGFVIVYDQTKERETRQQLEESRTAAERANRAKTVFLANISHEVRTPINTILGADELILREYEDEPLLDYARDIKNAGITLKNMISDVIDFSKLESGKLEIIERPYRLTTILSGIERMIRIQAVEKGLKVVIRYQNDLPEALYGDAIRIHQCILNLMSNAVKFTDEGQVTLSITGERHGINRNILRMMVHVEDTGCGIREEDIRSIGDSFNRIQEEKYVHIRGTGLGLSITQNLLLRMGSTLEVKSTYGEGSDFSFQIDQKICEDLLPQAGQEEDWDDFEAPGARILLVDDNVMNLKVESKIFRHVGITPDLARSGGECIRCVQENEYDMIFMDYRMPGMDGVETLHRMEELEDNKCPDVPVIIVTANAVTGSKEQYLAEGFTDYLAKPVSGNDIARILHHYLPEEYFHKKADTGRKTAKKKTDVHAGAARREVTRPPGTAEVLDDVIAQEYSIDGMDDVWDNRRMFAEDREEVLRILHDPDDLDPFVTCVHSLKGTSRMVGAPELSEAARRMEQAGRKKDRNYISQNLSDFCSHYMHICDMIERGLQERKDTQNG